MELKRTVFKIGCFLSGIFALVLFAALNPGGDTEPDSAQCISTVAASNDESFPRMIGGTSLQVLQYGGYEGPYMEDGSNDEVQGVASILLKNTGEQAMMYGIVLLEAGEELQSFQCGVLLPGMTALVLESERKLCTGAAPGRIQATARYEAANRSLLPCLSVTDVNMGTIQVTNCSPDTLQDFCITYKTGLPDEIVLMGGVCYKTEPMTLEPGESRLVRPDRYASGYSRIVWAE